MAFPGGMGGMMGGGGASRNANMDPQQAQEQQMIKMVCPTVIFAPFRGLRCMMLCVVCRCRALLVGHALSTYGVDRGDRNLWGPRQQRLR